MLKESEKMRIRTIVANQMKLKYPEYNETYSFRLGCVFREMDYQDEIGNTILARYIEKEGNAPHNKINAYKLVRMLKRTRISLRHDPEALKLKMEEVTNLLKKSL
jgi:hypothetical protein